MTPVDTALHLKLRILQLNHARYARLSFDSQNNEPCELETTASEEAIKAESIKAIVSIANINNQGLTGWKTALGSGQR